MRSFSYASIYVFATLASLAVTSPRLLAAEPIRIGILQSQSGPDAIGDAALTKMLQMLIDEQNAKGGLLGRPIESVLFDPASKPDAYSVGAQALLLEKKVDVLFGGSTSLSCGYAAPVVTRLDSLLLCPGENDAGKLDPNVISLGLTAEQKAIPAIQYVRDHEKPQQWLLVGTDSVPGKNVNSTIADYLKSTGVKDTNIDIHYGDPDKPDWSDVAAKVGKLSFSNKQTAVLSTVLDESSQGLAEALAKQNLNTDITSVISTTPETSLPALDKKTLAGNLVARSYFESLDTPENRDLRRRWEAYNNGKAGPITEAMASEAIGFAMWVKAAELAGVPTPTDVSVKMKDVTVPGFSGNDVTLQDFNSLSLPVLLGKATETGDFVVEAHTPVLTGYKWAKTVKDAGNLVTKWNVPVATCVTFDMADGCVKAGADTGHRTVDLLYSTDREVLEKDTDTPKVTNNEADISFGVVRVSVPKFHEVGQVDRRSWYHWMTLESISDTQFQLKNQKVLSADQFAKEIADSGRTDALVFVHGFRNSFEDSVFRMAQIVWDTNYQGVPVVFSWPSMGEAAAYGTDLDRAEYGSLAFRQLLQVLRKQAGVKTIHVIAHSMGAKVVIEGLLKSAPDIGSEPLGELVFAAPDVDRDLFAQQIAEIVPMAHGVTLYANSHDWALSASEFLRKDFLRAGDAANPPGPLVVGGVDTVDISSIGQDFFSLNHSTFAESPMAMEEIATLLAGEVHPPSLRTHILVGMPEGSRKPTYWKFP